jgi:soluble lytic murein transglycosylase-like protein
MRQSRRPSQHLNRKRPALRLPQQSPAPKSSQPLKALRIAMAGTRPALRRAGLSVSEWQTLFQANIEIESAYRANARSSAGAIGLGQLMPATAAQLGVDPHDWQANLDGSARYLLMMLAQFGTPELALAAYNAGPNAVARYGGIPPYQETQNHVRRVMAVRDRLTGAS